MGLLQDQFRMIAGFCEHQFQWGYHTTIRRFRTLLWRLAVVQVLRHAALLTDEKEGVVAGKEDSRSFRPSRVEATGTPASVIRTCLGMTDESHCHPIHGV